MKKKVELILNIITLIIIGIIIVIQFTTKINIVILYSMILLFVIQIVALIVRLKEDKNKQMKK